MRAKILIILGCLLVSDYSLASIFSCRSCGLASAAPQCTGNLCVYDTPCQCTDPGVRYNNCIDRCTYCRVFGNIGAR